MGKYPRLEIKKLLDRPTNFDLLWSLNGERRQSSEFKQWNCDDFFLLSRRTRCLAPSLASSATSLFNSRSYPSSTLSGSEFFFLSYQIFNHRDAFIQNLFKKEKIARKVNHDENKKNKYFLLRTTVYNFNDKKELSPLLNFLFFHSGKKASRK